MKFKSNMILMFFLQITVKLTSEWFMKQTSSLFLNIDRIFPIQSFRNSLVHTWMLKINDSVQFSLSVLSNSLWSHVPQNARPPCPSPTPGVHPNLCPLSRWCHPTISSSVIPFSSCPQSFPASRSSQMCWIFASGGQNIGISASTSVLPMNTQDWFPLGWTGWTSLQSKELSRVFSNTTVQFFDTLPSLWSNFHIHTLLLEKP